MEWISEVSIADYTNTSSQTGGYQDFTSESISLAKGVSNSVTLTPGFSGSAYNEAWAVWIDYNQNQVFESFERVVASSPASSTISNSFTVPGDAQSGSTRMRIVMKYNATPGDPCEAGFNYGEVEDYTVSIN